MGGVIQGIIYGIEELYGLYESAVEAGGIYAVIAQVVVTIIASVAVSKISQALAGKKSGSGDPPQRLATARGTTVYQQLIYGQVRTGGYMAYMGTSGAHSRFLLDYLGRDGVKDPEDLIA